MFWLQVIVALAVVLITVLVAAGRGDALGPLPPRRPVQLPEDRPVRPGDVVGLRIGVALRGYRMDEVDGALDRLAEEIADRDNIIAELRDELVEHRHAVASDRSYGHPADEAPGRHAAESSGATESFASESSGSESFGAESSASESSGAESGNAQSFGPTDPASRG